MVDSILALEFFHDQQICSTIKDKVDHFVEKVLGQQFKIDSTKILIAGGYVAYVMNKTNSYSDIDLFIPVEGNILATYGETIATMVKFGFLDTTTNDYNTYIWVNDNDDNGKSIISLRYNIYNVIFFKVGGRSKTTIDANTNNTIVAVTCKKTTMSTLRSHLEILKSFDLAVCRVGYSYAPEIFPKTPLIDYEWYGDGLPSTAARIKRKKRYDTRKIANPQKRTPQPTTVIVEKYLKET